MNNEELSYFWELLKVNVADGHEPKEALELAVIETAHVFSWKKEA